MKALEAGREPDRPRHARGTSSSRRGKLDAVGGRRVPLRARAARPDRRQRHRVRRDRAATRRQARKLILAVVARSPTRASTTYGEVRDYLDDAERARSSRSRSARTRRPRAGHGDPGQEGLQDRFDERFSSAGGITGVPTGFADLDQMHGRPAADRAHHPRGAPRRWARRRSRCRSPRTRRSRFG